MWVYFWSLLSVTLISMFILVQTSHCLEFKYCKTSKITLLFKNSFSFSKSFVFPCKFFNLHNNTTWTFHWVCKSLKIAIHMLQLNLYLNIKFLIYKYLSSIVLVFLIFSVMLGSFQCLAPEHILLKISLFHIYELL